MLDRPARAELINAISDYLGDRVTAFAFDEHINEIAHQTEDKTVRDIVSALWFHYDDCRDHNVVLAKEEWDYFQRLMLVLASDSEIHTSSARCWSLHQAVAFAALACFGVLVLGFHVNYCLVALPFGVLSISLSRVHKPSERQPGETDIALTPFDSFSEIRNALRRTPAFRKRRFPQSLVGRRIRGPVAARLVTVPAYILWLVAAPVVLLFQVLPDSRTELHVRAVSVP
jgi:hypothetical protein